MSITRKQKVVYRLWRLIPLWIGIGVFISFLGSSFWFNQLVFVLHRHEYQEAELLVDGIKQLERRNAKGASVRSISVLGTINGKRYEADARALGHVFGTEGSIAEFYSGTKTESVLIAGKTIASPLNNTNMTIVSARHYGSLTLPTVAFRIIAWNCALIVPVISLAVIRLKAFSNRRRFYAKTGSGI